MSKTIDQLLGDGGRGISRESGVDPMKDLFDAAADDLTEVRDKIVVLATMLDAEGTLGGGYVTAATPAVANLVKG